MPMPIEQKDITITEVKDSNTESHVETVDTPEDFYKRLSNYNISDLSSAGVNIKQDGEKYIFAINGNDTFSVLGKQKFESFVKYFYEQKKQQEQSILVSLDGLKLSVFSGKDQILKQQSQEQDKHLENGHNIEVVKNRANMLHDFYETQLDESKWNSFLLNRKFTAQEKASWKINKTEAKNRLKQIEIIQKDIERIEQGKYTYEALNQYDAQSLTLQQFSEQLDKLSNDVPAFITTRNDILLGKPDTVPYYDIKINTKNEARALKNALNKYISYTKGLNKIELKVDKKQEYAQDLQDLEEYLNKIAADPDHFDPSKNPFTPKHQRAFNYLLSIDPSLKKEFEDKKNQTETGTTNSSVIPGETTIQDTKKETQNINYESTKEAFEKGGINGMIKYGLNKTNMTPGQKEFWSGAANIAMVGGMVIVGWKMLSSAFSLMTKKGREGEKLESNLKWLGIPALLIAGTQAWKGEGPWSLLNGGKMTESISGIFGKSGSSVESKTYSEGFVGVSALFSGMTYPEVANLIEADDEGKIKIKADQYDNLVTTLESNPNENKKLAAKFLRFIGKDDQNNMIDLALTGMGVDLKSLQDPSNEKKTFNETAANAIVRLGSLTSFLEKNKYDTISKEQLPVIKEYIKSGIPSLEDLEKRGDVFQRNSELPPEATRTLYQQKVDALNLTDHKQKKNLVNALNRFYFLWPTTEANKQGLDITKEGDILKFKTYDFTTELDLDGKTLKGLKSKDNQSFNFGSTVELLKAANLTNYIKKICSSKTDQSSDGKPFKISIPGSDIEFNDAKIFSTTTDTEIISAGWNGNLEKVSSTLEQYKDGYVNYLNGLKFWKPKTA